MNLRILVNMACIAMLAAGVYLVKYSVQDVQRNVAAVKRDLAAERESLHLLKAEWAYLNRPERLRKLADRHLDLVPLDSRTINQVGVLPAAATVEESVQQDGLVHTVAADDGAER
jgi:cell division protein FtsL